MISERALELINGALDDVLTKEERDELNEQLASSVDVKRYYDDMKIMDTALKSLPEQEVTADVSESVMGQIKTHSNVVPLGKRGSNKIADYLSYGLATAAGIIMAVGYYETRTAVTDDVDYQMMAGTIATESSDANPEAQIAITESGVSGEVKLVRRYGKALLDISIESDGPVDLSIDFDSSTYRFDALRQNESDLEQFEFAGDRIQVRSQGRQRFTVWLHRNSDIEAGDKDVVRLTFLKNGAVIQRGSLTPG